MARQRLPLRPLVVYGLLRELRLAAKDERPLLVAGSREHVAALRHELLRGASDDAVREGGTFEEVSALVYVIAGEPNETDERELRAASRSGVPIVCVAIGVEGDVPHLAARDVIHVRGGAGYPIDRIARALARRLGEDATPLAARLPVLREAVCEELIAKFSRRNGLVGAAFFVPGADLPVLTVNQMRLVLRVASAYGFDLDRQRAGELLGVVGGGLALRSLSRQLLNVVPVAGWAVKGAVAYVGTRAIGEAAVRYFEARTP